MNKGDYIDTGMLWPGQIVEVLDEYCVLIDFAEGFVESDNEHHISPKSLVISIHLSEVSIITQQQYDTRVRLGKKALQKIYRSVGGDKEEYLKIVDNEQES